MKATSLEPCRYIHIDTESLTFFGRKGKNIYGTPVKIGDNFLNSKVVFCRPNPCFISSITQIRGVSAVSYKLEKLDHNYIIFVEKNGKVVDKFVYPMKVWDVVFQDVVLPFINQKNVSQQGVVLYGPPGTGKTSLASLISELYGLYTVTISPSDILSKYVGESEKGIHQKLLEAERNEPSVVLVDDAEWLLRRRDLGGGDGVFEVRVNLANILLQKIEEWNRNGKQILFLATTNAPISSIDPALLRSGRLGKPVYIPLPDYEAVYEFLKTEGIPEDVAKKWAYKTVNLGLNSADMKKFILPKLKNNEIPKIEPKEERGFRRLIPEPPDDPQLVSIMENFLDELSNRLGRIGEMVKSRMENGQRTEFWVNGPVYVSLALGNMLLTYKEKLPSVVLTDLRKIDDAVEAANMLRGFLIIPETIVKSPQEVEPLLGTAFNVMWAGKSYRNGIMIPVLSDISSPKLSMNDIFAAVAVIVLSTYSVKYTRKNIQDLVSIGMRGGEEKYLELLNRAGFYADDSSKLNMGILRVW
ncbi:MAG: ATP-binding protein [Thermoproteota archaeon]